MRPTLLGSIAVLIRPIAKLLAPALALSLLAGCASWMDRSPRPAPGARSGRDPLDQWDAEVIALFLQAQLLLHSSDAHDAAPKAAALLLRALDRQPEEPLLWRHLSKAWAAVPDFERAAEASQRAVDMEPQDGTARFLLGEQLHRLGRAAEAEPHLRVAVKLGSPGDDAHLPYYYHYAVLKELRRVEEALGALDAWEEALPDDPHPPALRARMLWDEGREGEAASVAVAALRRQPRDEDLVRMVLRYHRLDPLGAAAALEVVLESDWSVPSLHRQLVALYAEIGQVDRALEHLRFVELLERRGGYDLMLERAGLLLARHDADGVLALLAGHAAEAAILPHEVEIALRLAQAHRQLGELPAALAVLDTVRGPSDQGLEAVLLAAELLRQDGRPGPALERLIAAQQQVGAKDVEGRARLLEATLQTQIARQDWDAAAATLAEVETVAPRRALFLAADLARAQKRRPQALQAVAEAHEGAIDDLSLATLRADLLAEMGRTDEAIAVLVRAERRQQERLAPRMELAAPPQAFRLRQEHRESMVFLLLRRSFVEHRAGDLAGAEASLLRVLDLRPQQADALNGLAYLWVELGPDDRMTQAEDFVRQALEQQPYSAAFLDTLGCVLLRTGRLAPALEILQTAARYAPRSADIQEHLADVLQASGEMERALAVYAAALLHVDRGDVSQARLGERIDGKVRALQATGARLR